MDRKLVARELMQVAKLLSADGPEETMLAEARFSLASALKPILGMLPRFDVSMGRQGYMYFTDDVGTSAMGVLSAVFSSVTVKVTVSTKPLSDGTYYADVDLAWQHHGGGTNGGDVATAWFNPAKGSWQVQAGR